MQISPKPTVKSQLLNSARSPLQRDEHLTLVRIGTKHVTSISPVITFPLQAVTLEQVKAVAASYLTNDQLTITSLDPETQKEKNIQVSTKKAQEPITEHTLSNGLKVLLKRDPRIPTIYLQSPFLAGLPSETQSLAGLGTLHAATFRKGTAKKSALEQSQALESLGARLNLSKGNNTALLSGFCLSPDLAEFLLSLIHI